MNIISNIKSPNFSIRKDNEVIDTIIIHYTGMNNSDKAINRLCDPNAKVSSHYFINRNGLVWQLVEDRKVAWHAGVSKWLGRKNLNETSIGIELCNPGHYNNYSNFTNKQYKSLEFLIKILKQKYFISSDRVLGHSDIAPNRKKDPGEKFNWKRLARENLAIWPKKIITPKNQKRDIEHYLQQIGYDVELNLNYIIRAFKRHFVPRDKSLLINENIVNIAYSVSEEFKKNRSLY